jgi:hypothetical protein
MKKINIGSTERGLLFVNSQFKQILKPGSYRFWNLMDSNRIGIFDIAQRPELTEPITKFIAKEWSAELSQELLLVRTSSTEVAAVYAGTKLITIVQPSEQRMFWRGLSEMQVRVVDIKEKYQLLPEMLKDQAIYTDPSVLWVQVPEQSTGLLLENGVVVQELGPGAYGFWRAQRDLNIKVVDGRLTALEINGQELLSKDKVSLRLNVLVSYRVVNAALVYRSLVDYSAEMYRLTQLALRQLVGEKKLDELLENKLLLNSAMLTTLRSELVGYGLEVSAVGVKDIILPGEMRALLNKVVEAEKAAEAQNIRRREETAATRSLLNTARMMENNPILLRLKELESVERVSEKVQSLNVYDGMKGVMTGLVSLTAEYAEAKAK